MKIAVDFRFLAGGPNVVNRGTGRYTQHQLNEVLKLDRENEYLLVCHHDDDLSLVLPEIRAARNLSVARLPAGGLHTHEYPNHTDRALRLSAQVQDWFYKQRIDLYHETTPYQIDELVMHQFDACPTVSTLYDMIPMVYPQYYWPPGSLFHDELGRAFQLLRNADRLLAISESARDDGNRYLGISKQQIDLAYPFADPMFRQLPQAHIDAMLRPLRSRLSLPATFLLSLSHMHHSKNLENLFAAYGRLPESLRRAVPLVIVFYLRDSDRDLMFSYTSRYGITDNVIFTGLISDDELVALYNAATIVVHPSRYEGFGLPVVEAMSCGAPVITTTTSSLPEVGGDAAVLVDPDDVQGIADAIEAVLADPGLRRQMGERSLEQVKKFNPEQLGRNTFACYQTCLEQAQAATQSKRPRLAFWSSLPPLKCGIADYSVELLKELNRSCEVEIFVDDGYMPAKELLYNYTIHHHSAFERRHEQRPFDAKIYQMGISTMHDYMFEPMRKHPGLVVIHDVIFSQAFHHVYNVRMRQDAFKREIVAPEGPQALRDYQQAQRLQGAQHSAAMEAFFERHLLLRWAVDSSLAQLVHTEVSCEELSKRYPNARPTAIDMGVVDPWEGLPPLRPALLRPSLELPRSAFVIGVFGSVARIKRVEVSILAFRELLDHHPDSLLVVVGEADDEAYAAELRELANRVGVAQRVRFTGRIPRQAFDRYLLACNVVVNLRYPPRQQMSAVLIRAIAAGKPVIVTDIPEWRYFPEEFCWRVTVGDAEVPALAARLRELAADPAWLQRRSEAARAFFEQRGNLPHMARQYLDIVYQLADQPTVGGYRLQDV
jgi:glycosyltransferase involved in cell wall biosynthesis